MQPLQPKPSLTEFVKTMTPFFRIPQLDQDFTERVERITSQLLDYVPQKDPIKNLISFLRSHDDNLGIILAVADLSQEKLLRIITAIRFANQDYGSEWNINQVHSRLRQDNYFARNIAELLIEGRKNETLQNIVPKFILDQFSLPADWPDMIRDCEVIGKFIRKKLTGEYNDVKGDHVEALITERIEEIASHYNITYEHGQVTAMGLDKEVDIAIPNLQDPHVLVMVSYMETTSSAQTARANEQMTMFNKVIENNNRYGNHRAFVNFVDGAGWIARNTDLAKMHRACDYCININTVDQIEPIIFNHLKKH